MENTSLNYYQKNTKEERFAYPLVQKATTISKKYLDDLFSKIEKTKSDKQPLTVIVEKKVEKHGSKIESSIQILLQFCIKLTMESFTKEDDSLTKLFPTIKFVFSQKTKEGTCSLVRKEELEILKDQIERVPVGYLRKTRGHISFVEGDNGTNLLEREIFFLNFSDYYKTMENLQ